ncbi:ATP-binding protein [Kitasatospora sp. NPDC059571]|uniref:ATP-binding protein n=1 Tax=Kitasatospora sp. NPDC059571 TaxID=3346871 RepID=UPI0036BAC4A0
MSKKNARAVRHMGSSVVCLPSQLLGLGRRLVFHAAKRNGLRAMTEALLPCVEATGREVWMPHHVRSAGVARAELRRFLAEVEGGECYQEAGELALTELVANAVRHARCPADKQILIRFALVSGMLRIEVHDAGDRLPAVRTADDQDEGGRGLWLVQQLSVDWGWERRQGSADKSVWCLVARADCSGEAEEHDRTKEEICVIAGRGATGITGWDGPVVVEIEDVTAPATFNRLPDAVAAAWNAVRRLPMTTVQYEAYRYFLTRADAVERVGEFIRRDGELNLSLRMDGRLHCLRMWPSASG